jgi:hypothetical protein
VAGVLLALGIGFLAPFVGRLVRAVALWVAAVIGDFARWSSSYACWYGRCGVKTSR